MEGLAFKFDWFKEVLGGCDVATPCFVVTSSLEALTLSKEAFGVAESYEKFHKKKMSIYPAANVYAFCAIFTFVRNDTKSKEHQQENKHEKVLNIMHLINFLFHGFANMFNASLMWNGKCK